MCASVFKVKIAIKGLSTSSLSCLRSFTKAAPSCSLTLIKVGEILNKTASSIEHKKENSIEPIAYMISSVMKIVYL